MYSNRVSLTGFLGKDAEIRNTRNNSSFAILSLATKRSWKDRETGDYQSETTWHRLIAFGKLAEFAGTLTKGAHVQVEGAISTREYAPSNGKKRNITEVKLQSIVTLDRKASDVSENKGAAA